jgi:predicted PurR-regulated permease PerM
LIRRPASQPRPRRASVAGRRGERLRAGPARPHRDADARRADRSIAIVGTVFLLVAGGLLVWAFANVLLVIFAGLLFAVFLSGLAGTLNRRFGLSEKLSYVVVVATLAAVLIGGGVFLGAELAAQLDQLGPRMHQAWETMLNELYRYEWGRIVFSERNLRALLPENSEWLARLSGAFSMTLGAIGGFFIAIFIGLYGAATPHIYRRGFLLLMPAPARPRTGAVLNAVGTTLRWWLIGTFARMTVVGLLVTLGLWLMDVPLALALGLIAFVMDFVPYFGPVLAALPALLVALAGGSTEVLSVLGLYVGVQAAENYVVSPLIDHYSVRLPPALTISAQVLLGAMLGALGVVFATPLTAIALVLAQTLSTDDASNPVIGTPSIAPPAKVPPKATPRVSG